MNSKNEIVICLGSSCYSRGNDESLKITKEYLKEKNIKESTIFKGHLCIDMCNKGPVIKINGKSFYNVSKDNIVNILDENLKQPHTKHV